MLPRLEVYAAAPSTHTSSDTQFPIENSRDLGNKDSLNVTLPVAKLEESCSIGNLAIKKFTQRDLEEKTTSDYRRVPLTMKHQYQHFSTKGNAFDIK